MYVRKKQENDGNFDKNMKNSKCVKSKNSMAVWIKLLEYKRSDSDIPEDDWPGEPQIRRYYEDTERSPYPYGALRRAKTTKPLDPSWPSTLARHLMTNKELAQRLLQRNEKVQQTSNRKQYFKILPYGMDTARLKQMLENKEANELNELLALFNHRPDPEGGDVLERPRGPEDVNFPEESRRPNEEEHHALHSHHDRPTKDEEDSQQRETDYPNYEIDTSDTIGFGYVPSDSQYFKSPASPILPKLDMHMEDMEVEKSPDNYPYKQYTLDSRGTDDTDVVVAQKANVDDSAGVYIIAVVAGISAAATVGLIAFGIGWYNLQKHVKNASDVDYPAYGITGPNKDVSPSGDRRLAQSAQMYHYQHQKQQIIAMERAAANERHGSVSEAESEEENEEGDYTVYECPGLAPTGEMEVKNPMFQDDPTPAQTPAVKSADNGGDCPKK